MHAKFLALLSLLVALPALAQSDAILSKADAAAMFAMSKQQWNANVVGAAQSGLAQAIQSHSGVLKMGTVHPGGVRMLVAPSYDGGDQRPSFIIVGVLYPKGVGVVFTDDAVEELKQTSVVEMRPEYTVTPLHKKSDLGLEFTFLIKEAN